jgi:hypothetical protein
MDDDVEVFAFISEVKNDLILVYLSVGEHF